MTQEMVLATIGDLELTRRTLMLEIAQRDARIAELEAALAEREE